MQKASPRERLRQKLLDARLLTIVSGAVSGAATLSFACQYLNRTGFRGGLLA